MIALRTATADELDVLIAIDDDAGALFAAAGFDVDMAADHPFVVEEHRRWQAALDRADVVIAADGHGAVGFIAVSVVDGAAYVDQLAVRVRAMRHGVGRQLLGHAIDGAADTGAGDLWLNTYGHLAWNRPWYERHGFVVVDEALWRPQMRAIVGFQRLHLPHPAERVVMVRNRPIR